MIREIRNFGIPILVSDFSLTYDEELLLMKIREEKRVSDFRVNKNEFVVDKELSIQCCSHGWN